MTQNLISDKTLQDSSDALLGWLRFEKKKKKKNIEISELFWQAVEKEIKKLIGRSMLEETNYLRPKDLPANYIPWEDLKNTPFTKIEGADGGGNSIIENLIVAVLYSMGLWYSKILGCY